MASEGIANFAAVIGAVVPIVGLFLVWRGLSTWKSQIRWQNDHELARKIIVVVYRYRDALLAARSPFIWADELEDDDGSPVAIHESPERSYKRTERAHQNRWNKIAKEKADLYPLFLEADAIWGKELSTLWKGVQTLHSQFLSATEEYLESQQPGSVEKGDFWPSKDKMQSVLGIVFAGYRSGTDVDEFEEKLEAELSKIETYLTLKLGRPLA